MRKRNDAETKVEINALVARLLEHASCHEYIAENDEQQRQWMIDLRTVAALLSERLSDLNGGAA